MMRTSPTTMPSRENCTFHTALWSMTSPMIVVLFRLGGAEGRPSVAGAVADGDVHRIDGVVDQLDAINGPQSVERTSDSTAIVGIVRPMLAIADAQAMFEAHLEAVAARVAKP